MALFESFGDVAERLTARACTSLIGAHGPHFIGRYYPCKGFHLPHFRILQYSTIITVLGYATCYILQTLTFIN